MACERNASDSAQLIAAPLQHRVHLTWWARPQLRRIWDDVGARAKQLLVDLKAPAPHPRHVRKVRILVTPRDEAGNDDEALPHHPPGPQRPQQAQDMVEDRPCSRLHCRQQLRVRQREQRRVSGIAIALGSTPVVVSGGLTFASVSAGRTNDAYICGVTPIGVAYCWGSNNYGELGNGTATFKATPVTVFGGLMFTLKRTP